MVFDIILIFSLLILFKLSLRLIWKTKVEEAIVLAFVQQRHPNSARQSLAVYIRNAIANAIQSSFSRHSVDCSRNFFLLFHIKSPVDPKFMEALFEIKIEERGEDTKESIVD